MRRKVVPALTTSYLKRRALELATPTTRAIASPLGDWAVKKIRLDGRPFSFAGHAYLRELYDDTSPHIVLSKAAQIGGTVFGILRSFHACLNGLNVIYFFPTRTDVLDFSKSRAGPLILDNPFLASRMSETDTAGLKKLGDAFLYFRGMQSTIGMKSVPADMIVMDELDEATPESRSMAMERVAHSDYKRLIELSNPSLPGYGIDEQYEKSDQRHWTLKCVACGHWTALEREFPTKLGQEVRIILPRDDGSCYRACVHCGRELDLDLGEWVADYPGRSTRGYRISQLFSDKVDPGEILNEYRTTRFPDRFYNLKIGVPWADLDRRVDVPTVLALRGDVTPWNPARHYCCMGVDTGKDIHVVVLRWDQDRSGPIALLYLAVCQEFSELDKLMNRFQIRRCVIDGMPEIHSTRDFARRFRSRVYMCQFNENQRGKARWDRESRMVNINRTEALDESRAMIRRSEVILSRPIRHLEEFARHVAADAKKLEEDADTGAKKYKYIRTSADHFSLAFTYAGMAVKGFYPFAVA